MGAADAPATLVADCSGDGGAITVSYSEYPSTDTLATTLNALRVESGIDPDSGNCSNHASWPAEGVYSVSGPTAGRYLCTDVPGQPTIYWTDEQLLILSQASGPDADRLVDFWLNEAGPTR